MHYKEYSVFEDINDIKSKSESKKFISVVNDFIKVAEIVSSNREPEIGNQNVDTNLDVELLKIGIVKSIADMNLLKEILQDTFDHLLRVVKKLSELDLIDNCTDVSLKKFIDIHRKQAVTRYMEDSDPPTFVDFFSGAGGLSLGFTQNGFKPLLANDIEEVCTQTYWFNHYDMPKSRVIAGDIREIVKTIEDRVKTADVVIGGPPCQGFSMANRQRLIDDPRNVLYKYFVQAIEKVRPKFFVMENVKGMLKVADKVKDDFHNLTGVDYEVDYRLLNAKDFSVPQNRERLFFLGIRSDIADSLDVKIGDLFSNLNDIANGSENYSLKDAINDLKQREASRVKNSTDKDCGKSGSKIDVYEMDSKTTYLALVNRNDTSVLFNHKARYNNDRDIEIFGRMLPGDKSDSERIADIMPYANRSHIFKDKYYKLKYEMPCKTITAHMKFDCNMYIHPNQARGLTPREAARVQSYPDDHYFLGAYTKTYMQVGNSVPPLLSRAISTVLKNYL